MLLLSLSGYTKKGVVVFYYLLQKEMALYYYFSHILQCYKHT